MKTRAGRTGTLQSSNGQFVRTRAGTPGWRARVGLVAVLTATMALFAVAPTSASVSTDAPQSSPLEQVQAYVQPSVVYEQITWSGWVYDTHNKGYFRDEPFTVSFQCTGFVVNPDGYIATAGHCVGYDDGIREAFVSQVIDYAYETDYYAAKPPKATIASFAGHWRIDGDETNGTPDVAVNVAYGVSVSGEPTGKALPARVVGARKIEQGDVGLLKIEGKNLTTVPLSDNQSTGVGTQIVAIGYPSSVDLVTDNNFNPSFKEGSISAEKTTAGGLYKVYEISAAVSPGMSGGPTSDLDGRIIGVNSFSPLGETQAFNFVQLSQTLEELMRSEGVTNTPGEVTDLYRAGLAAYFAGDKDVAVTSFDRVLDIVPSHQFAQQYLAKAEALPASGPLGSTPLRIALILAAILAVLVIVVILVLVLRRRGKPAAATAGAGPAPATPSPAGAPTPPPATMATTPIAPLVQTDAPAPAPPPPGAATPTGSVPSTPPPPPPAPAASAEPEPEPESPAPPPPVVEETEVDLFCPNCGKQHEVGDHFCPHCGHVLR